MNWKINLTVRENLREVKLHNLKDPELIDG